MTGAEITQIVSAVISAIAVGIAAATVLLGVTAWRREFVGRRKIELAEEVLGLFYQARDAILYIRNPRLVEGEGDTRQPFANETESEKRLYNLINVTAERYNNRHEVFVRLHAIRYRVMARFGGSTVKPFDDLQSVINDLLEATLKYGQCVLLQLRAKDNQLRQGQEAEMQQYETICWWHGPDDPINTKVNAAIEAIEAICQPIIQKPSPWPWS